jgi:hypothetical protein
MDTYSLKLMQKRVARTAIGASTARRMGPKGTVGAARGFLEALDLGAFSVQSEAQFSTILDDETDTFVAAMPGEARHWGSCRKFLNIFLRDAIYNRFLSSHYKLQRVENWLEVPLDSHIAKGLRSEPGGHDLPRWKTVIGLCAEDSQRFQAFASKVARQKELARVHLDLYYWQGLGRQCQPKAQTSRR